MDFVVIDVETANRRPRSICQIGVASFRSGRLADLWGSLIDPEEPFSALNIAIHGIRPEQVVHAPTWIEIQRELLPRIEGRILASHTYFDYRAIAGANGRYELQGIPRTSWLDTCQVARFAWPALSSHRLPYLARTFGISYQAHNAADDARCAGEILLLAMKATGMGLSSCIQEEK